jgi:uncharacterized protein (TIGR02001 family)
MTRRREVGIIKSCVLGAAFAACLAVPAQADDKKLTLSATTVFTTDYIFRGVSNSHRNPAVQPEFDAYYGMFYAGMWGSNTNASDDNVEIDYYAGIAPKWNLNSASITFDIAGLYYSFPGSTELDYFELKTGATLAAGAWNLRVTNFWSPDNFGLGTESDAIEGALGYTFSGKIFNFFTPSVSGLIGFQGYESVLHDYTYYNAGLTLAFMDHWSFDVRYWDTTYNDAECFANIGDFGSCDETVVGTLKAVF